MKLRTVIAVCALALAGATLTLADEWNRKVELTFNKPVAIPAVHQPGWGVLPPGTYVFKIFDSKSDRHIVQIFNKEENEIYATILAIPDMRLEPTDKVVITFRETPAGEPNQLRAMFYPGRQYGEEFVYPKVKAAELAKAEAVPVPAMPATIEPEKAMPEAAEVIAELEQAPITEVEPSGEEAALPPFSVNELPRELPQTASSVPLLTWIGLGALLMSLILRPLAERNR